MRPKRYKVSRTTSQRDALIVGFRKRGSTLQEIGDMVSLSRERIRQILDKQEFCMDNCISMLALRRATNQSIAAIEKLLDEGKLTANKVGVRYRFPPSSVDVVLSLLEKCSCKHCGKPTGNIFTKFCSITCCKSWHNKWNNWSDEKKRNHTNSVKRWKTKNPEKLKNISKRACAKYRLKRQEVLIHGTV